MQELTGLLGGIAVATPAYTVGQVFSRLLLATLLGGLVGVEREFKRRPAGLRTNLFICFGSALFTILGPLLAGNAGEQSRIAAQIITGIGFIGAGSILHTRGGVQGLTTAATIFVVAAIGMAAGSGLALAAVASTLLALFCLLGLGIMEQHVFVRPSLVDYQATAPRIEGLYPLLTLAREQTGCQVKSVAASTEGGRAKLSFTVEATPKSQQLLQASGEQQMLQQQIDSFSFDEQE